MSQTDIENAYRRIYWTGFVTIAGLAVLAVLSWMGTVYVPFRGSRILLFASLALPAVFYVRAIGSAERVSLRVILGFALVFGLIGFVTVPFDSTDVFYYIAQGWHQAQYDANPYAQVLRDVPNLAQDPMISASWSARNLNPWLDLPLPYGFLFAALVRIIARLGQGNWWLTLTLFTVLNASAHVAIVWLVWRISHLIRLGNPNRAVFLYAWNPFVLAHSMGELHNDVLMGLFVVVAIYCLASRHPEWALAALVAGGLIKYIALALLPFAAVSIYRLYGKRMLAFSVFVAFAVGVALSAPYLTDVSMFRMSLITGQMTESTGSLHSFIVGVLRMFEITVDRFPTFLPPFFAALKLALWLAFGVFAVYELRNGFKRPVSLDRIIVGWTTVLAFILFFSSSQLYAWYIGMLLPVAVLAYESWVGRAVIAASAAHLFGFTDLKGKRIGYFIFCTLAPFVLTYIAARRERAGLHCSANRRVPHSAIALRS